MVFCREHHDIQVFSKLTKLFNHCTMAMRMSGQWHMCRTSDGVLLVNILTPTSHTHQKTSRSSYCQIHKLPYQSWQELEWA